MGHGALLVPLTLTAARSTIISCHRSRMAIDLTDIPIPTEEIGLNICRGDRNDVNDDIPSFLKTVVLLRRIECHVRAAPAGCLYVIPLVEDLQPLTPSKSRSEQLGLG